MRASPGPGARTGKKRVSGSSGRLLVGTCESSDNVGLDSCVVWRRIVSLYTVRSSSQVELRRRRVLVQRNEEAFRCALRQVERISVRGA